MIDTLLLTGAAGTLGRLLAEPLRMRCRQLVISDLAGPLATLAPPHGAQAVACDLSAAAAARDLLRGVDAVVHLGGVSVEGPFEPILEANIRGTFNLYDAARRAGTRRIVYASSNHVTGCHPVGAQLDPADETRPDGHYGLSKLFGEGVARMHHDRYGIESVCLRIGTATPEPADRRALSTWISPRDLIALVIASLEAPQVGCLIAYGLSDNPRRWWNCDEAWARLGFRPQDSAEPWASRVESVPVPGGQIAQALQGGSFLSIGPFD